MLRALKRLNFALARRWVGWLTRPKVVGLETCPESAPIYVLAQRSLTDLIVLDLVAERAGLPRPMQAVDEVDESRRFFFLNRGTGLSRRHTMRTYSRRMLRLESALLENPDLRLYLVPVSVFWGRTADKERAIVRTLLSENWATTSRLRRFLSLLFNRTDILVQLGEPIPWHEIVDPGMDQNRMTRRTARLLRVRFRNQRTTALGPDLSHRRTLARQILASRAVKDVIETTAESDAARRRLEKQARKSVHAIASDMSYPTIRVVEATMRWFFRRIYRGIDVQGLGNIARTADTHTLVFVPNHRSHVDYLVLSYMLFQRGFMLPHIAAGDNLDMPVVGGILRRCGAFFMRRSFQGDDLYRAVFTEYLYRVFRRGHSVVYFIEGGRTRTGRLLPARHGMLQMTLDSHRRGVPRPIAFVPVYFAYDKLIEANSYLAELRGERKTRESLGDVFRNLRLVRQSFGQVTVQFGEPFKLAEFLDANPDLEPRETVARLGDELLRRINRCATVNPVNLVALTMLSMPRQAIDEQLLLDQIECFRSLVRADAARRSHAVTELSPQEIVGVAENLGLLQRDRHEYGDILALDPFTSILMTWYRNNVLHVVALPALIACLVVNRRRSVPAEDLTRFVTTVYPYLARELRFAEDVEDATARWLEHLEQAGLLRRAVDAGLTAPPQHAPEHFQLRLLANAIMQTLERFYIAASLLAHGDALDRTTLKDRCIVVAQRMAKIYGIDAPEFFDARLFEEFIDQLVAEGAVIESENGHLEPQPIVAEVVRAAQGVISAEFRQAVQRPRQ